VNKLAQAAIVLVALLVALLASGCANRIAGAPAAGGPALAAPPDTTTTTVEPEPATNERGFLPTKIGADACYGPIDSDTCEGGVVFSIDKIVVDPPCIDYGQRSGHTLVLNVRVATGTDTGSIQLASGVFNPFAFIVIGKDGVSKKADFGMCTDAANSPGTYGPNQKYAFKIELDVPVAHGSLALQPGLIGENGSGGWEWPF
jgi:hypothetical protein